jgi:hypothetical protein
LFGLQNLEPKLEGYRLLIAGSLVRLQPAPPGFFSRTTSWRSGFIFVEAVAEWFNATVGAQASAFIYNLFESKNFSSRLIEGYWEQSSQDNAGSNPACLPQLF